jgi:hypothetical protein
MTCDKLFCKPFDVTILRDLLDKISYKTNDTYIINDDVYKRMLYHNLHTEFYNNLREYYQKSKHIYLDREFNYKTFTTVLRQLCKYTQITFDSCIKYKNSKYKHEYIISM